MVSDKGCLATPRSPVSTAGNSTPRREESFDFSSSLVRGELKDEVLISSNISWDSPLTSPKEIASLSRAIADSNSILRLAPSPIGCRISWRLFQAADRTYNGFVTPADLHRVLLSVYPSSLRMHADSIPLDPADATPLLLWDVLVLWRDMDVAAGSRQIIEHNILNNLVVPSDGLWAGVGLSATIRVWKNICRSAGYQFRFCAENYLHAAFRSVQSQGLAKTETLLSELEVVFFLINECLTRINASAAQLWRNFATLDISDLGHLDQLRFDHLVQPAHLPVAIRQLGPPPRRPDLPVCASFRCLRPGLCFRRIETRGYFSRSTEPKQGIYFLFQKSRFEIRKVKRSTHDSG